LAVTIHDSQKVINSKSYFFLCQRSLFILPLFLLHQLEAQHPILVMSAPPTQRKASPPSTTTGLLYRLILQLHIIEYVIADTHLLPMGGGVSMRRTHHHMASVIIECFTHDLPRSPNPANAKDRAIALIRLNIGETLHFSNLRTLASFFREGLGRE
jgi:hypothetical protein